MSIRSLQIACTIALLMFIFVDRASSINFEKICDVKCGDHKHFLCAESVKETEDKCRGNNVKIHDSENSVAFNTLKGQLISAHNGLRDRIAERMNVANMIELEWHDDLALMAMRFLNTCRPYEPDPCTQFDNKVNFEQLVQQYDSKSEDYKYIGQNMFCEDSKIYPTQFDMKIMHSWYLDKEKLTAPIFSVVDGGKTYYQLFGKNNFSNLASPFANNLGCALASYNSTKYCVACYYHPVYKTMNDSMSFGYASPGSMCPKTFPLPCTLYRNLCSADTGIACQPINLLNILLVVFTLIF